ncbi:unnamed protein product [Ambrosiozyma monospora]|uniref:Unnamed protein product n=1 Tax=Ambrosiozyma monospora TaxID=43982 RepID=A0A9W7DMP5_AMBMO|nr:unnamed protein product [Ambrosiozyma monospora]
MKNNVRTIVFCVVRKVVELLMKEVRSILQNGIDHRSQKDSNDVDVDYKDLLGQVMSYRGGYSATDRRKIESQMFHGNLRAIISTNALELGIDIGSLDAVVMCGFPISVANFHQQSGRAGRRNNDSLTVLVGSNDPISQHYMKQPECLLETDFPDLVLDFENLIVLEAHYNVLHLKFHSKRIYQMSWFFSKIIHNIYN